MIADWKIRQDSRNWECDWKGSERFHLRYFRSLSATEKFRVVENMCETAEYFRLKAEVRRRLSGAPLTDSRHEKIPKLTGLNGVSH